MDANNTPYFLLRTAEELRQGSRRMEWHPENQALTLRQKQKLRLPTSVTQLGELNTALETWASSSPMAVDQHYQVAVFNEDRNTVICNGGSGWRPLGFDLGTGFSCPGDCVFTDLAINEHGRMALPYTDSDSEHGVMVFHLGKRWLTSCALTSAPLRAVVDSKDRIWVMSESELFLCEGEPLPAPYAPDPQRFEPEVINPDTLTMRWQQALPVGWLPLAMCADNIQLCMLAHDGAGKQRIFTRRLSEDSDTPFVPFNIDQECPFAIDIDVAGAGRYALLAPPEPDDTAFIKRDCPVVSLHENPDPDRSFDPGTARLVYERYPMLGLAVVRFASSADGQLRYQAPADPDYPDFSPRPRELHALRQPRYEESASALLQEVLDSGAPGTVWHRIYLDACIPAGCSIEIAARVFDDADARGSSEILMQPEPVWNPLPSEQPYQQALAGHEPHRRGLFEILLQRPEGAVRNLEGRYLQLQVHLNGSGQRTPAIHAIRIYAPRFSYQEAYLPELFRQEQTVTPENSKGAANGADVRERLLANFESILTPLESRIAAAEYLMNPETAPAANLNWLSESLGQPLPAHWPEHRQRRWLRNVTLIQQRKGTLPALNLALDIVTDGGVQRGSVVVIENFRLRRTMATILGVSMDDEGHPLTLGTGISGNSIIGDSLILSEMNSREFLALFAPEITTDNEREAVAAFFDKYAHRLSILLHGNARSQRREVEEMLKQQLPAHLQWRIIETEHPFILGTSPLLSVDTWVEERPANERVTINKTKIGRTDLLVNPLAFSPRDINQRPG